MATTTSTDNTGLLDALKPLYEKESGNTLKWVAVGTGAALKWVKIAMLMCFLCILQRLKKNL